MKTRSKTERTRLKPVSSQPDRQTFKKPGLSYTISSRNIIPSLGVLEYIKVLFPFINPSQVTSLFGFTSDFSPLYGGRPFSSKHTLTQCHLAEMEGLSIHLALNMSNHFFNEESYQATIALLEKQHRQGNSVICHNDKLAARIRKDFPCYRIKASIIKNLHTREKVEKALELYDDVVIPMDKNDDTEFLISLPHKERIILFANASCAYTCPRRSCYVGISQKMQGRDVTSGCSKSKYQRKNIGIVFFDVQGFYDMGYRKMKLIPPFSKKKKQSLIARFQDLKTWHIFQRAKQKNQLLRIASYPKTGRTWLRYFLASYIAQLKNLDMNIDLVSMFTLFPNDTDGAEKGRMAFDTRLSTIIPLVLFSHAPETADQEYAKTLLLLRSIPDTLVSEYFHFNRHLKTNNVQISDYLLQGKNRGIYRLCRYLNSWDKQPPGPHFMITTYEALQKTPDETFEKILRFFNIDIDQKLLPHIIEQSSFNKMAGQEAYKLIPGHPYNYENVESRRMRHGRIGGYEKYLDEATINEIRQICKKALSIATKHRLSEHGLWPW